jgi:hypothetical protein
LPEFSLCPSALPWDLTNTLENAMPSHWDIYMLQLIINIYLIPIMNS